MAERLYGYYDVELEVRVQRLECLVRMQSWSITGMIVLLFALTVTAR